MAKFAKNGKKDQHIETDHPKSDFIVSPAVGKKIIIAGKQTVECSSAYAEDTREGHKSRPSFAFEPELSSLV